MRFASVILLLAGAIACSGGLFQEYEYEEELYLAVDGSATLYVNSSLDALNALRGTAFDTAADGGLPISGLTEYYTSAATRVTRVTDSERNGRLYAHLRIDVDDVRRLDETRPFEWSVYEFEAEGELLRFEQTVGASTKGAAAAAWDGGETVAFRVHVPSRIRFHNAGEGNLRRGNILVWEQPLAARLEGVPLEMDVRIEQESILNQTLGLFGLSILAVAAGFGVLLIWLLRRPAVTRLDDSQSDGPRLRI
ncbi:MAG: hypothetical protein AB7F99_06925 [Vicinamibacterales bacterium]